MTSLNEAKDSPMDRLLPGFQQKARELAKSRGASSGTREGRLAMLGILFDMDIIDANVVRMFKNDPSVSRMVDYFENNGIASKIKSKRDAIQSHIKDQLENKVSFTTGNRTDAAQQRYEVNKLNAELKAAKKVARLERKKETASAMSSMGQTVDMYDDLVGSMESSYSHEYMLEIVADRDSDLNDVTQIVKYLTKFVDENDVEVEGRNIDVIFGVSSKLGKIITKMGVENVERSISHDLKSFGGAGVVIHEPDFNKKEDMVGNLKRPSIEDEESYGEEMEEQPLSTDSFEGLAEEYSDGVFNPEVLTAQKKVLAGLTNGNTVTEKFDMDKAKRAGKNVIAAGVIGSGLVGGANYGINNANKISKAAEEIGNVAKLDSNKEFFSRLTPEEVAAVKQAMKNVRAANTNVTLAPNSGSFRGSSNEARTSLDQLVERLRKDHKIEPAVEFTFYENVNSTSMYLTEQVKSDSVLRPSSQLGLSFKEKYKPKTSQQLEELRRYGL
jgi:hypothetical protein